MVICKYYQQGTCRFGNNCRFEHTSDYGDPVYRGRYGGNQYSTNNYYSGKSSTYKIGNTSYNLEDILRMVIQEVIQSEKGGQWSLSCFAPIKEHPCFPGFEDYSPEEIRWKMYESLQNSTLPECQRQVKMLYDIATSQRNYILTHKEETFKVIEKLVNGQKVEMEPNFSFVQAASQSGDNKFSLWNSPGFAQNQQQQQTSVSPNFTFSLPQLGVSPAQPAFQQSAGMFGGTLQAVPSVNNQPSNIFGNSTQTQVAFSNVGQEPPVFEQQPQPAVNSSSVFDANKNVFNNIAASNTPVKSVFSSPSADNQSAVNWNTPQIAAGDNSLYTPSTELSQAELDAFSAQTFTMGKVPTKPPPKEICGM